MVFMENIFHFRNPTFPTKTTESSFITTWLPKPHSTPISSPDVSSYSSSSLSSAQQINNIPASSNFPAENMTFPRHNHHFNSPAKFSSHKSNSLNQELSFSSSSSTSQPRDALNSSQVNITSHYIQASPL